MPLVDPVAVLDLVEAAARGAGHLLLERFLAPARGVATKSSPTDLVSDADRDSESLVRSFIQEHRPDDAIVGEESGGETAELGLTWVIDPLDGTVNFLFGIPVWAVSIAVEDNLGALAGVVFDPNRDELFSAVRSEGARLNGRHIEVSGRDALATALIGTGFAYDARARAVQASRLPELLPRVRDIRRAGSAALDLASVACGRLDGVFEAPMERWDKAAGMLLVREAGGTVTELPGPVGLSPGVVAAGPRLHDALRTLVLDSSVPPITTGPS